MTEDVIDSSISKGSSAGRFIAMLALERLVPVAAQDLLHRALAYLPGAKGEAFGSDKPDQAESPLILAIDGTAVTVMYIDKPLPPGTLDNAIAANRVWKEARSRLAAHGAHAIVGLLQGGDGLEGARASARIVTAVAAALSGLMPAIGVYWASGETVTEAGPFRQRAQAMAAGPLPLDVWVQLLWLDGPKAPNGQRTFAVITTGLAPFVGREIEFQPAARPPLEVGQRVAGTISYLMQHGAVLKDGDTVGISPTERIRVRHSERGQRPGLPIYALTLEQAA
jgi:hypothetical protein